jgi:putative transposase
VHLRTTNRVNFRHRPAQNEGDQGFRLAGSRLAMAFKLIQAAQDHWRMVNTPHLVALVRAGATVINGKHAERPGEDAQAEAA